jgi:hypothetical protein
MKTRKVLTVSLAVLLAVWIVTVAVGGPSLAGAQQSQMSTDKGGLSTPEASSPETQIQKPAPPAPPPSATPNPEEDEDIDKYKEYETQC